MRPLQLEVVHTRSSGEFMSRIIGIMLLPGSISQVWSRSERAQRLRRHGVKGCGNLLGDIEDRLDAALNQSLPITSVIFRA